MSLPTLCGDLCGEGPSLTWQSPAPLPTKQTEAGSPARAPGGEGGSLPPQCGTPSNTVGAPATR